MASLYLPELGDIRIAEDGTRYPTAGAAVRGQIKAMKKMLDFPGISVTMEGLEGDWQPFYPKADSPLSIISTIEPGLPAPIQGDPDPLNPLPIYGETELVVAISGPEPDPEQPYTSYVVDLGQTAYKGTFDWSTGVLTLTHKMLTLTGAEKAYSATGETGWVAEGSYLRFNRFLDDAKKGGDTLYGWSSHVVTNKATGAIDSNMLRKVYDGGYIMVPKPERWGVSTAEEWEAYLKAQNAAGTPLQILYELKAPITMQLAPQQPKAPGGGENTFYTNTPATFTFFEDSSKTMERQQRQIETLVQRVAALEAAAVNNT
jgi:hypothetical protein